MSDTFTSFIETPIGRLTIVANDEFVCEVCFKDHLENKIPDRSENLDSKPVCPNKLTAIAAKELEAYFAGTHTSFSFPIKQSGTDFQQEVWQKLLDIPFGQTKSYAKFASHKPLAIRAIAAANGKNKLAIIIPCHRVIGRNGKLIGYAGGLWRKQWLLQHEINIAQIGQSELIF
ncbi:methylated-DNA-[protein]-cysteine S-methyltransferase [Pedobacter sp. UYEF25]